jgi:tRNA(Ile)-lysidine synthase
MHLTEHILSIAEKSGIDLKSKKFVIACSGGVDSMVLAFIFKKLNIACVIAHVNYGLRGEDADNAEKLVEKTAAQFHWKYEVLHAKAEMEKHKGESTQMAARRIRYEWLENVRMQHHADYIVLAHQQEDQVETFFIQLLRSASGESLSGMEIARKTYFRPLLSVSKSQLITFALNNYITWEEDKSNATDIYFRNKIRHHILPTLLEIDPNANEAIIHSIENLQSEKNLLHAFVSNFREQAFRTFNNGWKIEKDAFTLLDNTFQLLFELLKSYGFNFSQCEEIAASLNRQHGAYFNSSLWQIYIDRTHLLLLPLETDAQEGANISLELLKFERLEKFPSNFEKQIAIVDGSKLGKNLSLRTWQKGDYFYPIGLKGRKKISDFYTDLKLSREEKSSQLLLLSDNEVVWVLNKRLDQRFAASKETQNIVRISLNQ